MGITLGLDLYKNLFLFCLNKLILSTVFSRRKVIKYSRTMIPRLDVRTCFAGYKLTKRQSVLVFLSSVILVVFLLMLTRSSADKNIFSPANICDGKGGCEKDRTTDERSGVQRRLQTLPCKSKSRMDHRELRKNVVGFQYQLPGETVDKDEGQALCSM